MSEEEKRAAQTALPENIRELYRQIISEGYVYQVGQSFTQQITHDIFPEREPDIKPEIGLEQEPER